MKINKIIPNKVCLIFLTFLVNFGLFAQFSPDSLIYFEVQGNDTDPLINFDGAKKNQVLYNPTSSVKNTLLLHMVGSFDNPNSTLLFPSEAANNGFHCINLAYRNSVSGEAACGDVPDSDCHLNYRKEIIEGIDYSTEVNVNAPNSINNRILKLLHYLDSNHPSQNWSQYYSNDSILWNKLIVSGHSQGGGHAAVIGITRPVQRVLMFGSPNDFSDTLNVLANWTQLPHLVADSNYFSFNALFDEVIDFGVQFAHSDALNLSNYGDTVNVDVVPFPYNASRQLYTREIVTSSDPLDLTHDVMIRDAETPTDASGNPIFVCAWRYMLGLNCAVTSLSESSLDHRLSVYPNPAQENVIIELKQEQTKEYEVIILDLFGRVRESIEFHGAYKNVIPLQNYPNGIYIIQLFEGDVLIGSERFIKT